MNHFLWPTLAGAALTFWGGRAAAAWCWRESNGARRAGRVALALVAAVAAVPALGMALYYAKVLGQPLWLFEWRSQPGTELWAAGLGLGAGALEHLRTVWPRLAVVRRGMMAWSCGLVLLVPYAKPIVTPLPRANLTERWDGDVALQSTRSSCGPASAATVTRLLGRPVSEPELAREALTSLGGTENWYLARALRRRGFVVTFGEQAPDSATWPAPAIVGVRLRSGAGHFIPLLARDGDTYVVGDPLIGRETLRLAELTGRYTMTGFTLRIEDRR